MEQDSPFRRDASRRFTRALLLSPVMFVAHFIALTAVIFFAAAVVPMHAEFFSEMEFELPKITIYLLQQSEMAVRYWYLAYVGLLFVDGPILFLLQHQSDKLGWLKACWFTGWLLAAIVYLAWSSLALAIVYKEIISQLS